MKIGVLGAGAVGAALLKELQDNNYDPYIILNADRKKRYKPIKINDVVCDFKHADKNILDYVIVTVKNMDLEKSLEDIKDNIDENTCILSLLNGIVAADVIKKRFPNNRVLHGVIIIAAVRNELNDITYDKVSKITFGYLNNDIIKPEVQTLKDIFDSCNWPSVVAKDMKREIWVKWMLNVGVNQASAISLSNYSQMQHPYLREILKDLFLEVLTIAKLENVNLSMEDVDNHMKSLSTWNNPHYTSLASDFINHRKNELDYFSKHLIDIANTHNIYLPLNTFIYKILKARSDTF
ncbi:MAG: ketopantoate reductase family protein [Anaeroplasmataceae bacterium]